ncbi:MAG: 50S ribosomal protein L30 [Armatimonadota bacterium]
MKKVLKITLTKSAIGYNETQKRTVKALGLRKMGASIIHPDNPQIRGMVRRVNHLVTMEEVGGNESETK